MQKNARILFTSLAIFAVGYVAGQLSQPDTALFAQGSGKVYELRTYTTPDGKLENLHNRFRNHTLRIFQKHGMTNVVYWRTLDEPASKNQLVYVLAHASRDAAKKSWDAFRADPEWQKVAKESQPDGPIVTKVDSVFLAATDYSPMK